jgi:mannitol-1-phosphate 5-dehydrogenase
MALTGTRIYVGFGFGAIQAGLFLYEAFASGAFCRLVVAEVLPDVVAAVRRAEGRFTVNIAHPDRVEHTEVGPVEIEDPASAPDRERLVEAIAQAEEIATAIPSVAYYVSEGPGSLHHILAEGLRKKAARGGPRTVVYTAENHNHAAEILESNVLAEVPKSEQEAVRSRVRFLNTVIGKMSGVISHGDADLPDSEEIQSQGLSTVTPGEQRAFLVEAFNRILISKIQFGEREGESPFRRGIEVFEEKEDLLPFEEAKLYGHNATHALAAYVGSVVGVQRIADLREIPDVLPFLQTAFIEESGEALVRKYAGLDPLFTKAGYRQYAEDLLARMTNPYLRDTVERVGRDPQRKLGWDDRLIGTMRVALQQGVEPRRYAFGAAAALATLDRSILEKDTPTEALLTPIWRESSPEKGEKETVLDLIEDGRRRLRHWHESGFQDLEHLFQNLPGR